MRMTVSLCDGSGRNTTARTNTCAHSHPHELRLPTTLYESVKGFKKRHRRGIHFQRRHCDLVTLQRRTTYLLHLLSLFHKTSYLLFQNNHNISQKDVVVESQRSSQELQYTI